MRIAQTLHVWPAQRACNAATKSRAIRAAWLTDGDTGEIQGIVDWIGDRVRDAARNGVILAHNHNAEHDRLFHRGIVFVVERTASSVRVINIYVASREFTTTINALGTRASRQRWPWRRVPKAVPA